MVHLLMAMALAMAPSEDDRVGRVIIEGNRWTADDAILATLDAKPGMHLPRDADLLRAEIRMLMKFHRKFDLDGGKRPTIQVQPRSNGSHFRDVVIRFPEGIDVNYRK